MKSPRHCNNIIVTQTQTELLLLIPQLTKHCYWLVSRRIANYILVCGLNLGHWRRTADVKRQLDPFPFRRHSEKERIQRVASAQWHQEGLPGVKVWFKIPQAIRGQTAKPYSVVPVEKWPLKWRGRACAWLEWYLNGLQNKRVGLSNAECVR